MSLHSTPLYIMSHLVHHVTNSSLASLINWWWQELDCYWDLCISGTLKEERKWCVDGAKNYSPFKRLLQYTWGNAGIVSDASIWLLSWDDKRGSQRSKSVYSLTLKHSINWFTSLIPHGFETKKIINFLHNNHIFYLAEVRSCCLFLSVFLC